MEKVTAPPMAAKEPIISILMITAVSGGSALNSHNEINSTPRATTYRRISFRNTIEYHFFLTKSLNPVLRAEYGRSGAVIFF